MHCVRVCERENLLKQNKLGNFKFTCHTILCRFSCHFLDIFGNCTDSIERFVQILHDSMLISLLPLTGQDSDFMKVVTCGVFIIVCNGSCDTLLQ